MNRRLVPVEKYSPRAASLWVLVHQRVRGLILSEAQVCSAAN